MANDSAEMAQAQQDLKEMGNPIPCWIGPEGQLYIPNRALQKHRVAANPVLTEISKLAGSNRPNAMFGNHSGGWYAPLVGKGFSLKRKIRLGHTKFRVFPEQDYVALAKAYNAQK